jgi:hypothetical protein
MEFRAKRIPSCSIGNVGKENFPGTVSKEL